jgi:hypothetical protein
MYIRLAALVALTFAVAGCVTASNTLSLEQVTSLRVTSVNVGFARDARIMWGDGERAYAATKGLPAHESDKVANTPEAQAYMRSAISGKVKAAMERHLGTLSARLNGTKAVRAEVAIVEVSVASAAQRILVGGAHTMTADVTLVDAKTGAVVVAYAGQKITSAAGQGIGGALLDQALLPEPVDRLAEAYAFQYADWLMPTNRNAGG